MINAHPDVAQAGIMAMMANSTPFLTIDAAVTNFSDAPGQDNPFFEWNQRTIDTTANLKASGTFVTWLKQNNDPRIVSYFGKNDPDYVNQGDYSGGDPTYQTAATFVQTPKIRLNLFQQQNLISSRLKPQVRYGSGQMQNRL